MEISQGKSLWSYLKQAKMSFFFLFFIYRFGEQESRTGSAGGGHPWEGEGGREMGEYGANNVYTCMSIQNWYLLKLSQKSREGG
jgi:hypothetical protein